MSVQGLGLFPDEGLFDVTTFTFTDRSWNYVYWKILLLPRSVHLASWSQKIRYNPPASYNAGLQCQDGTKYHLITETYHHYRSFPYRHGVCMCVSCKTAAPSPVLVWWCSHPQRPDSSARWSCQHCPTPEALSWPPALWFPSVSQWQRVSPACRGGGGGCDGQ